MQLSTILKKIPLNTTDLYTGLENPETPIVDLRDSLNTFSLPDELVDAMSRNLLNREVQYINYALGNPQLRELIAQDAKQEFNNPSISSDNIALTAGARNAVSLLLQALINPLDEILIFSPYWTAYINLVKVYGGIVKLIPLDEEDNFYPDFSALEKACNSKTKILILNNPHNPTGVVWDKECITQLLNWAKSKNIFIIADELFAELIYNNQEFTSPAHLVSEFSNIAIIRAFSKSLSICGWRVGWIITHSELIKHLQILLQATLGGIHTLSQIAIIESWDAIKEWQNAHLIQHQERRDALHQALSKQHGFRTIIPQAGLTLFANIQYYLGNEVGGQVPRTAEEFVSIVYKKTGVKILPGEMFGIQGYVRFAFCEDIVTLEEAIQKIATILEK